MNLKKPTISLLLLSNIVNEELSEVVHCQMMYATSQSLLVSSNLSLSVKQTWLLQVSETSHFKCWNHEKIRNTYLFHCSIQGFCSSCWALRLLTIIWHNKWLLRRKHPTLRLQARGSGDMLWSVISSEYYLKTIVSKRKMEERKRYLVGGWKCEAVVKKRVGGGKNEWWCAWFLFILITLSW